MAEHESWDSPIVLHCGTAQAVHLAATQWDSEAFRGIICRLDTTPQRGTCTSETASCLQAGLGRVFSGNIVI